MHECVSLWGEDGAEATPQKVNKSRKQKKEGRLKRAGINREEMNAPSLTVSVVFV